MDPCVQGTKIMTLYQLKELFRKAGAKKLYAKLLAENDNSKNQVYFGPRFEALNLFPNEGIFSDNRNKPIFKAKVRFGWLTAEGMINEAPGAQFILYPQYPEVRFSGFLRNCKNAPSTLMASRKKGRILFLAVTADERIVGYAAEPSSEIANEFRAHSPSVPLGVFLEMNLSPTPDETDSEAKILSELYRVHCLGWINSKQLHSDGTLGPCNAPQCGGFTLEAELNIPKNSKAEPDLWGWEIKQHAVRKFENIGTGRLTLMTPEPTGGYYKEHGVEAFIRKFGYPDKNNRPDRLNFGGVHRVGERHPTTGLTMDVLGYDTCTQKIMDTSGSIVMKNDNGDIAASWSFSILLGHWSRKHAKAVYVPSMMREKPGRQYAYGPTVRLCKQTDALLLLAALVSGRVYYDPGIKLECASTRPRTKRRSQFRISAKDIDILYESTKTVDLCSDDGCF